MKKALYFSLLLALFCLPAMAQGGANFSGKWTLDASRSKLDERMRIESITLSVTQTDSQLTVETVTKRSADAGGGRGMMGGMGNGTQTYSLDGKETRSEIEGPMGKIPVVSKAQIDSTGTLKITTTRTFNGPMGEMTITTTETWQLSDGGKTLTIKRETTGGRGNSSTTLVFNAAS
ncbi:MAG TPA: hypothetical protein VNK26_02815 [Pyrinomonadaceae bacterium]|nr:hypothetical protein [Pyrinomonadaceae bacterium]